MSERCDICAAGPAIGLANLLGLPAGAMEAGAPLPPGFHILYFNPFGPPDEVAPDGHVQRAAAGPGGDLPRRMFAGTRMRFERPLLIEARVRRTEQIVSTERKEGRSGALLFVKQALTVADETGPCVIEEQTIVYRGDGPTAGGAPRAADRPAEHSRDFRPDEVELFRFSALSGNSHRIHYDQPYATGVEGYPALVVHGPLLALRLLAFATELAGGAEAIASFEFKALSPVFLGDEARLCATLAPRTIALWVEKNGRLLCMTAEAQLR